MKLLIKLVIYILFLLPVIITASVNIGLFILFIYLDLYLIVEIYKISLGKKMIDSSKGLAKYFFGGKDFIEVIFYQESLINAKGARKFWLWLAFSLSLIYVIWYIISRFILKM